MQKIGMVYVVYDYEGDIICACEEETQANKVIGEQEDGVLHSVMVPLYGADLPKPKDER
jgi:hypothetical protein